MAKEQISKDEQIGFHKGALTTLAKGREAGKRKQKANRRCSEINVWIILTTYCINPSTHRKSPFSLCNLNQYRYFLLQYRIYLPLKYHFLKQHLSRHLRQCSISQNSCFCP